MAKKRRPKCDLPPEGLWVSPEGEWVDVTEHLAAIYEHPEKFNLAREDIGPFDVKRLRDIACSLIRDGWTRFRYLNGTWAFEVDVARRRIDLIDDILAHCKAYDHETVIIEQVTPSRAFSGRVMDVRGRYILKAESNPRPGGRRNTWRFNN